MNVRQITLASLVAATTLLALPAPAAAQNPLRQGQGQQQGRQDPFVGTFRSQDLVLELRAGDGKAAYRGTLQSGGATYPCTATTDGDGLRGRFRADGEEFEFTVRRRGEQLALTSDGTEYTLTRDGGKRSPLGKPTQGDAGTPGGVGLTFEKDADGDFVVASVQPGGPAAKSVQRGWTLLAIDDKEVDEMTLAQIERALAGAPGSLVKLTFNTPREVIDAILQRGGAVASGARNGVATDAAPGTDTPAATDGGDRAPVGGLPEVVQPGQRLSFVSASATVGGVRNVLVEDDQGNWVDPQTGQHYSAQNNSGQGAMTVEQLDVLHASGGVIAGDLTMLLVDPLSGSLSTTQVQAITGTAEALGEYWVAPAKLATLQVGEQGGVRVLRGPYTVEGREYDTVTVRNTTAQGFSRATYDTRTGLCLIATGSLTGQPVQTVGIDGKATTGSLGTMIYQRRLSGARALRTPWAGSRMPLPERALEFAGGYAMRVDGTPDLPAWSFRASIALERGQGDLLTARIRTAVDPGNGQAQQGEQLRIVVAGALLPLAIAPDVLQQLRAGQEIDQDPVTRTRTWIEAADAQTVCLAAQSATEHSRTWFDRRTGMPVRFARMQRQGMGTTTIEAQRQG